MKINLKRVGVLVNSFLGSKIIILAVFNILLAATALFKDIFVASYLGTSAHADALLMAFFIPDTIGNNLIAAAIGTACIPVFSLLLVKEDRLRLNKCIRNIVVLFLIITTVLGMIFFLFRNSIIGMAGEGFSQETAALCSRLFIVILPAIVLYPLVTIGSSIMNVHSSFKTPAAALVLFNGIFMASALYGYTRGIPALKGVYLLAFSIIIAVTAMVLTVWTPLILKGISEKIQKANIKYNVSFSQQTEDIRKILAMFLPYILMLMSTQSVLYVERYLASHLDAGSVSGLNYAYRLAQFPIWVFVGAISTVILPSMSRSQGLGQTKELAETFEKYLRLILTISVPFAVFLYFMRLPVISVLLQRGAFDDRSLAITSDILTGYSLAIVGQSIMYVSLRVFMALGRMLFPLLVFLTSAIINIAADFFFVGKAGLSGLGYGAAIGSTLGMILIIILLRKSLGLDIKKMGIYIVKILAANIPFAVFMYLFSKVWHILPAEYSFIVRALYVFATVAAGLVIYWIVGHMFSLWPVWMDETIP